MTQASIVKLFVARTGKGGGPSVADEIEKRLAQIADYYDARKQTIEADTATKQKVLETLPVEERLQLATAAAGTGIFDADLVTGTMDWDARQRAIGARQQEVFVCIWLDAQHLPTLLAHCRQCGTYTFPSNAWGCRECGAGTLDKVPMPQTPVLRNFITLHGDVVPGLTPPVVVGEVEIAPGVVNLDVTLADDTLSYLGEILNDPTLPAAFVGSVTVNARSRSCSLSRPAAPGTSVAFATSTVAPSVTIEPSTTNAAFNRQIQLRANARDTDGNVNSVQYWANGTQIGSVYGTLMAREQVPVPAPERFADLLAKRNVTPNK